MANRLRKMEIHHNLRLILCFYVFYLSVQASGQIVVMADSVIHLGETFRLHYQYETKDSTEIIVSPSWNWEENPGYEVLMGPLHSTQTSTKVTNGKISVTYGETFTFLLSFNKEGRYTMPIMKAQTSSGKKVMSKPFSVRVNNEAVSSTPNISSTQMPLKNDLLVVETTVNKHRISLGDSVECEIRLYTKYSVISQMTTSSTFSASPAYWHEHELPMERSLEKVTYRGEPIHSYLWRKFSIIPLQAGEIVLEPMKFTITKEVLIPGVAPFEAIFNSGSAYIERDTVIFTNPIKIQVDNRQLPDKVIAFDSNPTHNCGLVIDRSSSLMARRDSLAPTFFQLEDLFIEQFIKGKTLSDYSTTQFAGKVHYLDSAQPSGFKQFPSKGNDGSAIYNAILASALRDGALTTDHSPYSILLLTDGSDNMSWISEKTLTELLLRHNIRVDVIVFASDEDYIYYASNDSVGISKEKNNQDYSDVKRIANNTNGAFILVNNKKQIPAAIRKISNKILKEETPKRQPSRDFLPEKSLLYKLYQEIFAEAIFDF